MSFRHCPRYPRELCSKCQTCRLNSQGPRSISVSPSLTTTSSIFWIVSRPWRLCNRYEFLWCPKRSPREFRRSFESGEWVPWPKFVVIMRSMNLSLRIWNAGGSKMVCGRSYVDCVRWLGIRRTNFGDVGQARELRLQFIPLSSIIFKTFASGLPLRPVCNLTSKIIQRFTRLRLQFTPVEKRSSSLLPSSPFYPNLL